MTNSSGASERPSLEKNGSAGEAAAAEPSNAKVAGEATPGDSESAGVVRESDKSSHSSFLRGPIDIRSVALTGLFLIASFHTLYVGRTIFIPLVLAILLSLMLRPPVRFLSRRGIPDGVGAGMTLIVLSIVLVGGSYALSTPAATWINEIPKSMRTVERRLRSFEKPIKKVKEVSDAVENVAKVGNDEYNPEVQVKEGGLLAYLLGQTQGALMMLFLTAAFVFFLLASGDLFLRKLVHVIPKFRDKMQAVEIVHRIQDDIAVYIFSVTIINAGLAAAVGFAMMLLGVPNAALWAVMAFMLNFVPYLGAITGVVVVGLVAFIESESVGYPLAVMAVYYALTTIEGTLVTPMVIGKRLRLNPVVVFLALIFWGWLWGIPGALLAVPILATFKILCDQLAPLNTVGEFLGR